MAKWVTVSQLLETSQVAQGHQWSIIFSHHIKGYKTTPHSTAGKTRSLYKYNCKSHVLTNCATTAIISFMGYNFEFCTKVICINVLWLSEKRINRFLEMWCYWPKYRPEDWSSRQAQFSQEASQSVYSWNFKMPLDPRKWTQTTPHIWHWGFMVLLKINDYIKHEQDPLNIVGCRVLMRAWQTDGGMDGWMDRQTRWMAQDTTIELTWAEGKKYTLYFLMLGFPKRHLNQISQQNDQSLWTSMVDITWYHLYQEAHMPLFNSLTPGRFQ